MAGGRQISHVWKSIDPPRHALDPIRHHRQLIRNNAAALHLDSPAAGNARRCTIMSMFRCYLMDNANRIVSVDTVEAVDDASAMRMADDLRRTKDRENTTIEVRDLSRCVGRIVDPQSNPAAIDWSR